MEWSKEQAKAINTLDKNIMISASAGAGKTMVLIGRLMHMIKDLHIGVDEILAMTFSEAAANEMKKRLTRDLKKAILDKDDEFLKEQLVNLNTANISTIHGFCLEIIKEYYYIIGLDKDCINNPLDEATCNLLKNKAMEKALDNAYNKENIFELSKLLNSKISGNDGLKQAIKELAELANSQSDPFEFIDKCLNSYNIIDKLNDLDNNIYQNFIDYFKMETSMIKHLTQQIIWELDSDEYEKLDYYTEAFNLINQNKYDEFRLVFMKGSKASIKGSSKTDYHKELQEKEKNIIAQLYSEDEYVRLHNLNVDNVRLLCEITKDYLKFYNEEKNKAKGIDFSDMEHYALKLLKANNGYVANIYKNKFKIIMVDEFQDTNDVQDNLVNLISLGNNVFRVGDIKQSIYGFRHALPSIMRNLVEDPQINDEVIYLSNNYRSMKTIVDFNNVLYSKLMNLDELESFYNEHDNVSTGLESQNKIQEPIQMHLIDKNSIDTKMSNDELKAEYIVKLIQNALNKGYSYKDIVILTRGNSSMYSIKKVLDKYQIPSFFSKKQGLYQSTSIENVINVLKCLLNPYDDYYFVGMVTSPLFQISYEEIANLRLNNKDVSLYEGLEKDSRLIEFIELREHIKHLSISDIIQKIYNFNNYYEELINEQERSNLDLLYEKISEYEQAEDLSLNGLVNRLISNKENDSGEAMPVGVNDDVVRIMTIHASKGLEFKVVLMYLNESLKFNATNNMTIYDNELHIGMKVLENNVIYDTPEILAYAYNQKRIFLEEELRLLYVATTRAEHEMHIIDMYKPLKYNEYDINAFYGAKSYSDWIRCAMKISDPKLYREYIINEEWNNDFNDNQNQTIKINKYEKEIEKVDYISPSQTELYNVDIKPFDEISYYGSKRGSKLHKMVELLPHSEWDKKTLQKLNDDENFGLNDYDFNLLLKLRENSLFSKLLSNTEIYHEMPFISKINNSIISGYMDFVSIDDNNVIMIDFKSDKNSDENQLLKSYEAQIKLYKQVLEKMYQNKKIKTYIYSLELMKMIEVK